MYRFVILLLIFSVMYSKDKEIDTKTLSKAMGHLVGKNIKNTPLSLDEKAFLEGIKECFSGEKPPLSEELCIQAINEAHEKAREEIAKINLKDAEGFLNENGHRKDIVKLEEGQIQYHIDKIGKGNVVQGYNSPLIRFKGTYLDGSVFGQSFEPERICLAETIPGFQKAIEGMKEGEIRTIYIHPSLGYKDSGALLPNSLLTYEIEVIKADVSEKQINLEQEKLITSKKS